DGIDAALGLWAQRAASVSDEWRTELSAGTFGELTGDPSVDQPVLDEWARRRTGGLIDRFPVQAGPELMLTLATAVALRTTWVKAFTDEPMKPADGPWRGRNLAGLARTTPDVDDLRVADAAGGAITVTTIAGDNGLDVRLVLGAPGLGPADVLPVAVDVLAGDVPSTTGSALLDREDEPVAPGVATVVTARPSLATRTVRFTVRAEHDLVKNAAIFGLKEVCRGGGHFSRIGPVPLQVDQARQAAVAIFSAVGFEAAAVTAIGLRVASMPVLNARGLAVTYDRPFGFLATHRATGLIVFGGWVTDPE
ncbi:MAG: serpin family protein, partial [Jiangellaceae bacterium]